ncbi:MAG TPA: glycosyltransferase family 61 protein, partial [Candidatus Sulfotelmatobacter sp.]|nr:glycosyltransferase family 61 protein [Candidatus Sulfotelmatobacter sp.]
VAARHGFEPVSPEALGFVDQVKLFAAASVIAGPHGAGLANMVFAPPGTPVVELIGPRFAASGGKIAATYETLAATLGHRLTRVIGEVPAGEPIRHDHLPYETYRVDPAALAGALRRATGA